MTDQDIIESVKQIYNEVPQEVIESSDEDDNTITKPSSYQAFLNIQSLQLYFASNSKANEALAVLNKELVNCQFLKLRQSKITDFMQITSS